MYGYIPDFREIGYRKLIENGLNETQLLLYLEETIKALEIYNSNMHILEAACKEKGIDISLLTDEENNRKYKL